MFLNLKGKFPATNHQPPTTNHYATPKKIKTNFNSFYYIILINKMNTILTQIHNYIIQNQQIHDDFKNDLLSVFNDHNNTTINIDYPSKCYLNYLVNSQHEKLYQTVIDYINNQSFESVKYLIYLIKLKI